MAVLVTISALANLLGTYMIRPVVNSLAAGSLNTSGRWAWRSRPPSMASGCSSAYGYTQIMVKAAQKVLYDIRRDLFAHLQTLPLRFFDTQRHGDVMSYFTNDVDTISDALNNSFAMVIQSFIQMVGTLIILFHPQLAAFPDRGGVLCRHVPATSASAASAARPTTHEQQDSLGDLDGYIEEMVAGQKVVKVFNHEEENLQGFPGEKRGSAQGRAPARRAMPPPWFRRWSASPISITRL